MYIYKQMLNSVYVIIVHNYLLLFSCFHKLLMLTWLECDGMWQLCIHYEWGEFGWALRNCLYWKTNILSFKKHISLMLKLANCRRTRKVKSFCNGRICAVSLSPHFCSGTQHCGHWQEGRRLAWTTPNKSQTSFLYVFTSWMCLQYKYR